MISKKRYPVGQVADAIDWIVKDIDRCPERYEYLTPENRTKWDKLAAQVREHRFPWMYLDPNRPLLAQLESLQVGRKYIAHCTVQG